MCSRARARCRIQWHAKRAGTIAVDGTLSVTLTGNGGVATLAVALQDDAAPITAATIRRRRDILHQRRRRRHLSVTIDDGTSFVDGGDAVGHVVTVRNAGPEVASGAHVSVALSSNLLDATWTCAASAGASCAAEGAAILTTS